MAGITPTPTWVQNDDFFEKAWPFPTSNRILTQGARRSTTDGTDEAHQSDHCVGAASAIRVDSDRSLELLESCRTLGAEDAVGLSDIETHLQEFSLQGGDIIASHHR